MKKFSKLHLIVILVFVIQFPACKKDQGTHTVKGIIYKNCALEPLSNTEIELDHWSPPNYSQGHIATTTTNSNGEYKLEYQAINDIHPYGQLMLKIVDPPNLLILMNYLPKDEDITLDVIANNTATLVLKLDLTSPLSINDTLYYYRRFADQNYFTIIGPTKDTILKTYLTNDEWIGSNGEPVYGGTRGGYIFWGIGLASIQHTVFIYQATPDTTDPHVRKYTLHGCGVEDQVTIKVN